MAPKFIFYHNILCDLPWPRTPSYRSYACMCKGKMTIVKKNHECEGKYILKMVMPYCGWVCKKMGESEKK